MIFSAPGTGSVAGGCAFCAGIARRSAILAVLGALSAVGPLPEPLHVRFRLPDGVWVSGDMSSWDEDGFDGSFGRRAWTELMAEDVWRLYRRVIDADDVEQWVNLGRVLLASPQGEPWGERAFRRALRLDPSAAARIEAARREASEARRRREEREEVTEAQRLRTLSPEAGPWPAEPWPSLTAEEQEAAVGRMQDEARGILGRAAMHLEPMETDYFLVYSDLPPLEAARWATRLDTYYAGVGRILHRPEGENLFSGKAVVFLFRERDRFRLVEAESFDQLVPAGAVGICHPVGPKVFLSFHRDPSDEALAASLAHELVHGVLHRYLTPRRLPAWANEGFAEYVTAQVAGESTRTETRRRQGLAYIRGGGDMGTILSMTYDDRTWPGRAGIGYAVGSLLVELMIVQKPARFYAWVRAVKTGEDWEHALAKTYGVARDRLIETAVQYYNVND